MKATRNIILGVVAAMGVVALPAAGQVGIDSSAHDFSSATWKSDGSQICSPCHTPHASDTSVATAPLWNHELTTGFSYDMNDGGGTITERTLTAGFDDKTILCLSCHDGTVAIDSFGGATGTSFMDDINSNRNIAGGTKTSTAGTDVLDMSNDHPVGLGAVYPGTTPYPATSPYPLFTVGATTDTLGCVTCHEVHNDSGNPSLLRETIASSALCQGCHNK
jgi:predicted CXXCH cytochrome family protein